MSIDSAKEGMGMAANRVTHTIEPVFGGRSRVLVLGTMPSPASREVGFYYGHPQNRFWRVMERLFGLADHALVDNDARTAFLLEHRIALWDVLAACSIEGASDARSDTYLGCRAHRARYLHWRHCGASVPPLRR